MVRRPGDANWISQRTAETLNCNLHHISIRQLDAVGKTETVGSEEMNVDVPWSAMRFKFEMMMFDVLQAMAHFRHAAAECFGPKYTAAAFNPHVNRHRVEGRIDQ